MENYENRILNFDPSEIYSRVKINKYKRQQSISVTELFPPKKYFCNCGCGLKLEGRRTRWASDDCSKFASSIWGIMSGHSDIISKFLRLKFDNWACCKCGLMDSYSVQKNGLAVNDIHKDHILAVVNGGGGCWIDNYQLLCSKCHKLKTKNDLK